MAEIENQVPVTADSEPAPNKKEKKVAATKTVRAKPSHPPTSEMVNNAIKGLKERGGSSVQAIKKYLAANYKVDSEKMAPFIKKYLKSAVSSGALIQTKGKGASGSFKLASATLSAKPAAPKKADVKPKKAATATTKKTEVSAKKVVKPKPAKKEAKPKVAKVKKAASPKAEKKAAAKPKVAAAAPASPKQKAVSKAKKTKVGPTKKPKAPKPKTAKAVASPKKK